MCIQKDQLLRLMDHMHRPRVIAGCQLSLNEDLWLLTYHDPMLESTEIGRKIDSIQSVLFFYHMLLTFTIPLILASA